MSSVEKKSIKDLQQKTYVKLDKIVDISKLKEALKDKKSDLELIKQY